MAVGPFRALLLAHAQTAANRTRRELGRSGVALLWISLTLLVGVLLLPAVTAAAAGGYLLGRALDQRFAATLLGLVATGLSLGAGLALGLVSGSRQLTFQSYRAYPLRPHTLFFAELFAGLGDLWNLALAALVTALFTGLAVAQPAALPWIAFAWACCVLTFLCAQLLVGGLALLFVKSLRAGLIAVLLVTWAMGALAPTLLKEVREVVPRGAGSAEQLEELKALGERAADAAQWLPGVSAVAGVRKAVLGDSRGALAKLGYAASVLAALGALAFLLLRREGRSEAGADLPSAAPRGWTFRTPAQGVARLHWATLVGSTLGRFGFLMPLAAVVLLKGPFAHLQISSGWLVPAAFTYAVLGSVPFAYNQFGLDRHGVKALLLLPISAEDLLKGKAWGLWAYQGCQIVLLAVLLAWLQPLRTSELLGGLAFAGCLCVAKSTVGQWTSLWLPRPILANSMSNQALSTSVALVSLGALVLGTAVFGGVYATVRWLAPATLAPAMALLLFACVRLHGLVRPLLAAYLEERREALVVALG